MKLHRIATIRGYLFPLACILLAGCRSGSPDVAAQRMFSLEYTCPADRVTVARVEGATLRDSMQRLLDAGISEEVRKDPERLAMRRKQDASTLAFYDRYAMFHVAGCGHVADYGCFCPRPFRDRVTIRGGSLQDACSCIKPPVPAQQ